jgi:hypothetical protein
MIQIFAMPQAWCDVVTDGGGFILIGVKDTPVTWAIPSKPTYIDPNGRSQWSSALGNKLVLDFRVQISTSKSSSDTKSHWYCSFFIYSQLFPMKQRIVLFFVHFSKKILYRSIAILC